MFVKQKFYYYPGKGNFRSHPPLSQAAGRNAVHYKENSVLRSRNKKGSRKRGKKERREEEDCEIGEMFDGDAYDEMVLSKTRGSEQMFAQFLNVTCKFTETLEDLRKQELMVSRSKTDSDAARR